ncbi:MAG: hypothetical protein QM606_03430, partial [Leucobacter sp.]
HDATPAMSVDITVGGDMPSPDHSSKPADSGLCCILDSDVAENRRNKPIKTRLLLPSHRVLLDLCFLTG